MAKTIMVGGMYELSRQKNGIWRIPDNMMCSLVNALADAKKQMESEGYDGIAGAYEEMRRGIHDLLDEGGYFDDVEV